jgi:hypothetical protein
MELPPILLDREVRRAAALAREAREELARRGTEGTLESAPRRSPLEEERRVSSRSTYLELGEMRDDPLLPGLRAWVLALTLERVLYPDRVRLAAAWHEASVEVEEPERGKMSPRALFDRVLADRAAGRRRAWAEALARGSGKVAEAAAILADRRAEAARRLSEDAAEAMEVLCRPAEEGTGSRLRCALGLADRALAGTAAMADLEPRPWEEVIARSMARGATAGWPARLSARWLEEIFSDTGLMDGLAIRLGKLPEPLGAISFARAFADLGRAFAEASAPPSAPFVMAHPPFDLRVARRSALFGGLLADPLFGARALGLGRDRARAQAREIARGALVWLRLLAMRVKLRGALVLPLKERNDRFEEETARALGAPLPSALLGVVPKLEAGDVTRFFGALLSAVDRRRLVERFDEDWFRNPRAAEALREEQAALPEDARAKEEDLEEGAREIVRSLEGVLG